MNTDQTNTPETKVGDSRRSFLKETGKKALWAAPVLSVIMTASSQRAQADQRPSGNDNHKKHYDRKKDNHKKDYDRKKDNHKKDKW